MHAKLLNKSTIYISILLLLTIYFFHSIINSHSTIDNIHYINDITFLSHNVKESIFKYKTIHLWTPYFYSGHPLMAIPESYLFDLNFLYILLFRNIYLAMNLSVLSYFFLAGLGMYLLVMNIKKNEDSAFISALIYMFNGFVHSFVLAGHLNILESYSLIPFVVLFAYRAIKGKNFVVNALLAGLFFSMMILAGGIIFFLYTGLLLGLLFAFNTFGKNPLGRVFKILVISLLIFVSLIGLSAIKLLPTLEYTKLSNRASGVSLEEYLGSPIQVKDFWFVFISNIKWNVLTASIGITGFFLLVLSLISYKNKNVAFFMLLILISVLLASGSILAQMLYKYVPGFGQMRHIERALVFFALASSVLVGYGFENLVNKLKYQEKLKKISKYLLYIILGFIIIELVLLQNPIIPRKVILPKEIPILDYISHDQDYFRTLNLGLKDLIGAAGYNYNAQIGISEVKGGGGIWITDYIRYMAIAQQYAPSKLFGILNTKYIITDTKLNYDTFKFIQTFNDCKDCSVANAFGPYLYENLDFLPRAYIVNNSILFVGSNDASVQLIYNLMLNNFNQKNAVIIQGREKINDYDIEELKKFNAIVLTSNSIDENSIPVLRDYANNGGIILPNIFRNKNAISNEDIDSLFAKLEGNYSEAKIVRYEPNKVIIEVKGKKGFLVLSEVFSYFPGWNVFIDGNEEEMLKADNVITSLYLDGNNNEVVFFYKPRQYIYGKWITIISTFIIISFFSFRIFKKSNKLSVLRVD